MNRDSVDQVIVRPYQPLDQAGVEWLYSRTPPWGRTYPRPEAVPDDLKRIQQAFEHAVVAVEQDRAGEAVVGLAAVRAATADEGVPLPSFVDVTRPTARLKHVLVAPERWRCGIGRRVVSAALDWAQAAGYSQVVLDTTAAQTGALRFYQALGFEEVGRSRFREWELVWFCLPIADTQ